jgi:hypothetical protein
MEEKPQDIRAGDGSGSKKGVAIGVNDSHDHHMIPVWFFVGVILLIYGILILATGIYEISSPPPDRPRELASRDMVGSAPDRHRRRLRLPL